MSSRKKKQRFLGVFISIATAAALMLIGSSIALMLSYTGGLEGDAGFLAQKYTAVTASSVREAVDSYIASSRAAAAAIVSGSYQYRAEFEGAFPRIIDRYISGDAMFVRYFDGDTEYSSNGLRFDSSKESPKVLELAKKNTLVCAGVVEDRTFSISAIPIIVPLEDFQYATSIVIFYPTSSLSGLPQSIFEADYSQSRFMGICSLTGETITILHKDDFTISQHNNVYEVLRSMINDKSVIDSMRSTVMNNSAEVFTVTIGSTQCSVAVETIDELGTGTFFVVGVFDNDVIASAGYQTARTLLSIFGVLFIVIIVISVALVINFRNNLNSVAAAVDTDEALGCPNRAKFERASNDILNRNKATKFAVIVIDINHYDYLNEQNGHDAMMNIMHHLKLLYSKMLQLDETYGYLNSGRFVLLLHYREMENLESRISQLASVASAHGASLTGRFPLEMIGGIYLTERNLTPQVSKMIDLAVDAESTSGYPYDFGNFRIYNELIHASRVQNDYIELHMDSALEHKDFKVFYQPKYHILNNKADGAEALVRWYNPEINDYMQPGVFIPLFEANKFIIKLDKYVYNEVCAYVSEAIQKDLPVVPISVNVSRITAAESDFVRHYISVKDRYGIPDGFLTIEFTESFANEDYDMLREVVGHLHENGFKCSIDDFGSGFSSYNVLKELPMDEIKLDRFFIKNGLERDRDLKVLKSVIELGRSLNMKVTQEGVETIDQLALLRSLGCHVIQGYHYSRPLTLAAFLEFLENKGSR